jgi:hypothetical protein
MTLRTSEFGSPFTRRTFLYAGVLAAAALAVPGCGGGNGGSGPPSISQSGTLSLPGLSGTSIFVASPFQAATAVTSSGSFSTTVSTHKAHLVFATDSAGQLRGLAVSIPGKTLDIGAESSLIGLLFLTPGILETGPSIAVTQVSALVDLPAFTTAFQYLEAQLATTALQAIVQNSTFPGLLQACVLDFYAASRASRSIVAGPAVQGFSAAVKNASSSKNLAGPALFSPKQPEK